LSELVHDGVNGYVVEPFSSKRWAEKMNFLLTDKTAARSMGRMGRQLIEKQYDTPSIAKRLEALYLDVVADKPLVEEDQIKN
jgi:glycosyltransferase involved in cell wall biosynthesis